MGFLIFNDFRSKAGEIQRFKRILEPLIRNYKLLDDDIELNIDIKDNQLLLNDISIGDYRYMSNFRVNLVNTIPHLEFDYSSNVRSIFFGFGDLGFFSEKRDCVKLIFEATNGVYRAIWENPSESY